MSEREAEKRLLSFLLIQALVLKKLYKINVYFLRVQCYNNNRGKKRLYVLQALQNIFFRGDFYHVEGK